MRTRAARSRNEPWRPFHPRRRRQRGRRQGDGRSNARMVRPSRLPREQCRNSLADGQHHRDRYVPTIDQVLAVNVRGVILGTKHAALAMLKTGSGSIINIGSVAGHPRRPLGSRVYGLERGGQRLFPLRCGGAGRKGNSRQHPLARSDRDWNFWKKCRARRLEGGSKSRSVVKEGFATIQPMPRALAFRMISHMRRFFSPVTGQGL